MNIDTVKIKCTGFFYFVGGSPSQIEMSMHIYHNDIPKVRKEFSTVVPIYIPDDVL